MSKKDETTEKDNSKKVMTNYDKKKEARIAKQKQEERNKKITKMVITVVGILLAAAVVFSIANPLYQKQKALNSTYVSIGTHNVKKVEYDFYYNLSVTNYLNTYGSYLALMGLDATKDFSEQEYAEGKSWKDNFDELTVSQLQQVKILSDEIEKNGFTFDVAEQYTEFKEGVVSAAETAKVSVKQYYKNTYGKYATEENIKPLEEEFLLTTAYYQKLIEDNKPADKEVSEFYEENIKDYDTVDYHRFSFKAETAEDATEEQIAEALVPMKEKAEEMMARVQKGEDFETLCIEYSADDAKAEYEDNETEKSLTEDGKYTGAPSVFNEWLYDAGRKAGDMTVAEDITNKCYYVVKFEKREKPEDTDSLISNSLSQKTVGEMILELEKNYEVKDVAGDLKYLTIPAPEADNTSEAETDDTSEEGAEQTDTDDNTSKENTEE